MGLGNVMQYDGVSARIDENNLRILNPPRTYQGGLLPGISLSVPIPDSLFRQKSMLQERLHNYYDKWTRSDIAANAWLAANGAVIPDLIAGNFGSFSAVVSMPQGTRGLSDIILDEMMSDLKEYLRTQPAEFVRKNYLPSEVTRDFEGFIGHLGYILRGIGYEVVAEYDPTQGDSRRFLETEMPRIEEEFRSHASAGRRFARIIMNKKPYQSLIDKIHDSGTDPIHDLVRAKLILGDISEADDVLRNLQENDNITYDLLALRERDKPYSHPEFSYFAKSMLGKNRKPGLRMIPGGIIVEDPDVPGFEKISFYLLMGVYDSDGTPRRGSPGELQILDVDMLKVDKGNHHLFKQKKRQDGFRICPILD
ncbi:hypothetical protein JW968_04340 [Candidatus Woesearchaeota archaeon]|nr:hypothetical protein [Candidatus Woesearchaeota archaeon]